MLSCTASGSTPELHGVRDHAIPIRLKAPSAPAENGEGREHDRNNRYDQSNCRPEGFVREEHHRRSERHESREIHAARDCGDAIGQAPGRHGESLRSVMR